MADYQCFPLWHELSDDVGDIDPRSLPISDELANQLLEWARLFDATLNMEDPASSGFPNVEDEVRFKHMGRLLAKQLQDELGAEFKVSIQL